MQQETWTVRDLRRRWKPVKDRLRGNPDREPLVIRVHRACSWLHRVEQLEGDSALDTQLIFRWIALNSLYGRWDEVRKEPQPDRSTLFPFLDRLLEKDADGRIAAALQAHRRLVMSIFEDEYLTRYYWQAPSPLRAKRARKTMFNARTWYVEKRYGGILTRLMERIYLLRCQLVHGAATHGGQLNRTALKRCATMLGHLMPVFLLIMIDHGHDDDWGPLCYPPNPEAGERGAAMR